MTGNCFTVEMGEELYSLVAPDGTAGEMVEYEVTATIMWNGHLYYAHVDDPDAYPEDSDGPEVHRVDATTVMESKMEEVSDDEEGNEEEEDEEEEDEEEQEGDVIEFPPPAEEEEDENLPPAEGG